MKVNPFQNKWVGSFLLSLFLFLCLFLIFGHSFSLKEGLANSGSQAFCESHSGFDLETSCNNLTKYNCGVTSCCIWTSDNKCKAGNASGPTFHSDDKGKSLPLDYYYFQNKCYGEKCP
jgi:hypothetical protein